MLVLLDKPIYPHSRRRSRTRQVQSRSVDIYLGCRRGRDRHICLHRRLQAVS